MSVNRIYDSACSVALSASAGSGKTYALTTRLLSTLLSGTPPSQILAITFTNAAANDIREELFNRLSALERSDPREVELFGTNLGMDEDEVLRRARDLGTDLIRNFSTLHISTIHSFFTRVIGCFPKETGVVDYAVVDDHKRDVLLDEAIVRFFEKMHGDRDLFTRVFELFASSGDRGIAPSRRIRALYDRVYSLYYVLEPLLEDLAGESGRIEKALSKNRRFLQSDGYTAVLKELISLVRGDHEAHGERSRTLDFITTLEEYLHSRSIRNLRERTFYRDYASGGMKSYLLGLCERLSAAEAARFERLFDHSWESLSRYVMSEMHHTVYTWLVVYLLVQQIYGGLKEPAHLFDFADIELKARDILLHLEDFELLQHRLDSRIRYLLIDEFQDTSELQWSALRPLAIHCLQGGGTLFYVGDVKQSIYRWRGGEPYLFQRVRGELDIPEEELSHSYRQNGVLLDFVNRMGRALQGKTEGRFLYEEQTLPPGAEKGKRGFVHVSGFRAREALLSGMLRLIGELPERGVSLDDVAVLCRKNREVGEIETLLRGRGIRFNSAGRTRLMDDYCVKDVVNILRFVTEPDEPLHLSALLRTPFLRHSYGVMMQLAKDGERMSLSRLRGIDLDAHDAMQQLIRLSRYTTLSSFMHKTYELFDLFSVYRDNRDSLLGFLELAYTFEESGEGCRIDDFVRHLDRNRNTLTLRSGDSGGITVQTIHTAKGLEYHTVILPFIEQPKSPRLDGSLMYSRDGEGRIDHFILASKPYLSYYPDRELYESIREENAEHYLIDEINTLYVALTRARENLILLPMVEGRTETMGELLLDILGCREQGRGGFELSLGALVRSDEPGEKPVRAVRAAEAWERRPSETQVFSEPGTSVQGENGLGSAADPHRRRGALAGVVVHSVLQQIGNQPPGEREMERMLRSAISREGRAYAAEERKAVLNEARRMIEAVIHDPRLERFFGEGGNAEITVLSHRYENLLGRIDRLCMGRRVAPRRVIEVLDFKTHPVNTADELESLIAGLRHQVEEYCTVLEEIFTHKPVRGYLYFTEAPYEARLVQVYGEAQ